MGVLLFLAGLVALVLGAEALVRGASRAAAALGVSPLVIGLTIVAFGTSAPEAAVSVGAVLEGNPNVAIGNVVGSNIFNVLFILGVSALIAPLVVHLQVVRQELPVMIGASLLVLVFALDGTIGRAEAGVLLALLVAYTTFLVRQSRAEARATPPPHAGTPRPRRSWDSHVVVQLALIGAGLALLVLGSQWLVEAASGFARDLGASDLVIGLTIVAAGTSLPEVATSLLAAWRGERDIAVGNVIGSNTFNLLGCLGLSGVVGADGLTVAPAALSFDLWVMVAAAVACLPVFISGRVIDRWEGIVFLAYYAAYTTYLILAAQQHEALGAYSTVMLSFVIPLTLVTLVATLLRHPAGRPKEEP